MTGIVRVSGQMGVNQTPNATTGARLSAAGFIGNGAGSFAGIQFQISGAQSANSSAHRGFEFAGVYDLGGFSLTDFIGVQSQPAIDDSTVGLGLLSTFAAFQGRTNVSAGSAGAQIVDAATFDALAPALGAAAGVTTQRGVRVRNQGHANVLGTSVGVDIEAQSGSAANRTLRALGNAPSIHEPALLIGANAVPEAGFGLELRDDFLLGANFEELREITAPAAPGANGVRLYAEDNGAGKTRLMARFATGTAVQLAVEP